MADSTAVALTFVLVVQAVLMLSSASVAELVDGTGFYAGNGSLINSVGQGSNVIDPQEIAGSLPAGDASVRVEEGFWVTDIFGSIKSWFTSLPGINYIYAAVMAPYNILKLMGLPELIVFVLGSLWYSVVLYIFISFFWKG